MILLRLLFDNKKPKIRWKTISKISCSYSSKQVNIIGREESKRGQKL